MNRFFRFLKRLFCGCKENNEDNKQSSIGGGGIKKPKPTDG